MAGGVSVALFHAPHEAVDGGQKRLANPPCLPADRALEVGAVTPVLLLVVVIARSRFEDVAELVEFDRFEKVVVSAGPQTLLGRIRVVAGRQAGNRFK